MHPGGIDPAVTQSNIHQTICVTGYTSKVRPSSEETDRFAASAAAEPASGSPRGMR